MASKDLRVELEQLQTHLIHDILSVVMDRGEHLGRSADGRNSFEIDLSEKGVAVDITPWSGDEVRNQVELIRIVDGSLYFYVKVFMDEDADGEYKVLHSGDIRERIKVEDLLEILRTIEGS